MKNRIIVKRQMSVKPEKLTMPKYNIHFIGDKKVHVMLDLNLVFHYHESGKLLVRKNFAIKKNYRILIQYYETKKYQSIFVGLSN